ncbi:hypothetical protein D9Q81_05665 [Candidatus Korarchaeum cryptofilum]|jgi:hypothetical protein|uniref:Uncharacterized protein n=2 Tax=Candidatus Korarchaeia TaxID=3342163 RepID=A0A3R9PIL4_9CREN|nr:MULTISPECIES: hypothetical protein [Candidatus Korarchaeota]RSN68605.1 hypothetical protein D9Q81_05665 [Candidatus Korarchaeum cryptofilum]RSN74428.1 hypothetical protein D6D85_08050 [Candidatus Methanodesulfokores washburnensis]
MCDKALYKDEELYSNNFDVRGGADLKIKDVSFNASYSSLDLEELTLEVRNEGNAPLISDSGGYEVIS